ncbi:MAG: M23 family metallopeptidase [Calditrichaeota bacterium]|nr:MAG: M23 family metallopeptidase [Calditrichota bacterium]
MNDKKVKIIYFSQTDSSAKQLELSWSSFFKILSATFVLLLAFVAVSLALLTNFYQNVEIASLSKLNDHLESQLALMGGKLTTIESRLHELEKEDDDLRLIADLPKIDEDTRSVGVGGVMAVNYELSGAPKEVTDKIYAYHQLLDEMERRIQLTEVSRDEIRNKLEENKRMIEHTPSIRPLVDGRINDRFGFRLHPVIEKIKKHTGVDIAAERGTEVFASAAGVVERVVTKYKVNRGYGKYVVIDHGYGIKTLYGHLSKVLVRRGQKVDRWMPIGLVGDTGLATGPHLHYEVIHNGRPEDPLKYILD